MELRFSVKKFPDEESMGKQAGKEAGKLIRDCTKAGRKVVAAFAAAPSQNAFLKQLAAEEGIEWKNVRAFHLDEYCDLPEDHPNTFRSYLQEHIFKKVPLPPENISFIKQIRGSAPEMAGGYSDLLKSEVKKIKKENGLYLNFIGIGVNGHIAFNEPGTDLWTGKWAVPVRIDETSVRQQFDDYKNHPNPAARYPGLEDVPRNAVTMTPAAILAADALFVIVPGASKAGAVKKTLEGPVTGELPASLLRLHENVAMFLDSPACSKLTPKPGAFPGREGA